jgi:hypothetical protein
MRLRELEGSIGVEVTGLEPGVLVSNLTELTA